MKPSQRIIDTVFAPGSAYKAVQPMVGGEKIPGAIAKVLFDSCEAKIMKYKKGATIPRHKHTTETLKFILRGRIETPAGEQLVPSIGDYRCGGFEYGPWNVLEDTYILVLQLPGTVAKPASKKPKKKSAPK